MQRLDVSCALRLIFTSLGAKGLSDTDATLCCSLQSPDQQCCSLALLLVALQRDPINNVVVGSDTEIRFRLVSTSKTRLTVTYARCWC